MSQTIASLSYQVDPGNIQQAISQLDQLNDSTKHLRASTQFMVTSVSNTASALTQLASSGRASLSSFISIAQNLDVVTQKLEALRLATSRVQSGFAGNNLAMGLSQMQRQMSSMAEFFGTTATAMEQFNRQAQYLHMNAGQTTAALQRIGSAVDGTTAQGQAYRQILTRNGVNLNQTSDEILAQFVRIMGRERNSTSKLSTEQAILGPITPGLQTSINSEPYRTVQQQNMFRESQEFGVQAGRREMQVARMTRQQQQDARAYNDLSQYVAAGWGMDYQNKRDYGGAARTSMLGQRNAMQALMNRLKKHPFNMSDMEKLTFSGDMNDIYQNTQFGKYLQFENSDAYVADRNEIAARARGTQESGGYFARLTAPIVETARDIQLRLFGQNTKAVRAAPGRYGRYGQNGQFNNSFVDGYRPLPFTRGKDEGSAAFLDRYKVDAQNASDFGYSGAENVYGAMQQAPMFSGNDPQYLKSLQGFYGVRGGQEAFDQQKNANDYILANAKDKNGRLNAGFFSTMGIRDQGLAAAQGGANNAQMLENQGLAVALLAFAKRNNVPEAEISRWMTGAAGGGALTPQQIIAGTRVGDVNVGLTTPQRQAFLANQAATQQNFVAGDVQSTRAQLAMLDTLGTYVGGGSAMVGLQRARLTAYNAALSQGFSQSAAMGSGNRASSVFQGQQKFDALGNLQQMDFANTQAYRQFGAVESAGGAMVGSRGLLAAQDRAQLESQLAQAQQQNTYLRTASGAAQYRRAAGGALAIQGMTGAQQTTAGEAQQLQDQRTLLSISQRRVGVEDELANKLEAQQRYAESLAQAQASGSQSAVQYVQQQIDKYTELKDKIDQINALMQEQNQVNNLQISAGVKRAELSAPLSQRRDVAAIGQAVQAFFQNGNNPLLGAIPGMPGQAGTASQPSGGQQTVAMGFATPLPDQMAGSLPTALQSASPTQAYYVTQASIGTGSGVTQSMGGPASIGYAGGDAGPVTNYALAGIAPAPDRPNVSVSGQLSPAAMKVMQPYEPMIAAAAKRHGMTTRQLRWQLYQESSGNPNQVNGDHVGLGQFSTDTAKQFHLTDRTNAPASIEAAAALDQQNMTAIHGKWSNPNDVATAFKMYGTNNGSASIGTDIARITASNPQNSKKLGGLTQDQIIAQAQKIGFKGADLSGAVYYAIQQSRLGRNVGVLKPVVDAATQNSQLDTKLQIQQMQSGTNVAVASQTAQEPYLLSGRSGQAALAGIVANPNLGDPGLIAQDLTSRRTQAVLSQQSQYDSSYGQTNNQIYQSASMTNAYGQGEGAATRAQATIQATLEALANNASPMQQAARAAELLTAALSGQAEAAAKTTAATNVQVRASKALADAALKGPTQERIAQASVAPNESIRQSQQVLSDPNATSAEKAAARLNIQQQGNVISSTGASIAGQNITELNAQIQRQGQRRQALQAQLSLGPVASPLQQSQASARAEAMNTLQSLNIPANSTEGKQYLAGAAQDAQLQYQAQQQAQQQAAFNQIPQAADSALTNSIFSFQHPNGQGLYLKYQLRNLLMSSGRDLFQASVGQPFTAAVQNNLGSFFQQLYHGSAYGTADQAPGSNGPGSQNYGTPGGGQSVAGGILNDIGGLFGGAAKGQLGTLAAKGLQGLFSSATAASNFGNAAAPGFVDELGATVGSGSPGIFSSIASAIGSFLANGGIASGGQIMPFANGGVFAPGRVTPFATGTIIDQPTAVPMALMGEAGPEAIVPLQRNASGKLGIAMGGGGGGGHTITVNAPITVAAGAAGQNGIDHQTQMKIQQQLKHSVTSAVHQVILQESVPGGMLNRKGG
jgi:hypothetical protein